MAPTARLLAVSQLLAALTVIAPAFAADRIERPEPAKGFSYPEYFCTNRGARVDIEQFSCLTVDGKSFQAQCDLSLNSPMWRPTGAGCESEVTSDLLPEDSY